MAVKSRVIPVRMTDEMFEAISECLKFHNSDEEGARDWSFAHFIRQAVSEKIHTTRRLIAQRKIERRAR